MNYALKILNEQLQAIENNYNRFVINGSVKPESEIAKENRKNATEIQNAIKELSKQSQTEQFNKHDVVGRSEQFKCGMKESKTGKKCETQCKDCKDIYDYFST